MIADVGGDLNIESLQDTNTYKVDEKSLGIGISLCIPPFCYGMSSISGASANFGATNIDSNYASVTEQSGIKAGDDGFDINVRGNTDLVGAVIASSDKAVQDGKNSLVTSSLTNRDIKNKADYDANTVSLGGYNEVGKDQKGNAQTGGKVNPGTDLAKNENNIGANMPIAISASDKASSVTRSGIVACASAAASSQSCGSGAAGAAASSLLTGLFSQTSPDESEEQREAKRNLIVSLVTGLAATSASIDPTTANTAAGAAVDNNWLATQQIVQFKKEYDEAKGLIAAGKVVAKWSYISGRQDVLTQFGIGKGLAQSGWNDVTGLAEFVAHPIEGLTGLGQLINNPEARKQFGDSVVNELNVKIETIKTALEVGGDENAEALGKAIGEIAWQVGSIATGVGGAAKGGVALAKAGIKVGAQQLEKMAEVASLAKFDKLVARGGQFNPNGTPLMDFRAMTNAQKSIVGDIMGGEQIKTLVPGAEKIGRAPDIGQTGIDDLYKVDKPGVDYLIVEYKFGSSKLKPTRDGLQMSDDWLQGTKTNYDRILESVGDNAQAAENIDNALRAGRVEKWLVHTDPFGNVTVGVLDKSGKFVVDPIKTSKLIGADK
ncbi:hypothetical protein [Pseudomonas sp. MH9.3]|uniref:hypothetical protein n=1 Tax=Pseudomonas sp. MH9.3 TaxID=3048630 RepID=UPI003A0FDFBD